MSATGTFVGRAAARIALAALLLLQASTGPARAASTAPGPDELQRAVTMVEAGAFHRALAALRAVLAADPANRRARELLAFTYESLGNLTDERRVRAQLAADYPDDPQIQAGYGRVLERSGEEGEALRAYRRARPASTGALAGELDTAIDRLEARISPEGQAGFLFRSDPDAVSRRAQAGGTVPLGSRTHLALLASQDEASPVNGEGLARTQGLALSLVQRGARGDWWSAGARLRDERFAPGTGDVLGAGGNAAARLQLLPALEVDARGEIEAPWDDAAVGVLHGGRTTGAEAHIYVNGAARRLLLQAGGRTRRLSVRASGADAGARPTANEALAVAGADLVLWSEPGATLRGEMLDESLTASAPPAAAVTLGYRHYAVTARSSPGFAQVVSLVPRASVDEVGLTTGVLSPRRDLWLGARGALAWDSARAARDWRAGGTLAWSPVRSTRLSFSYDTATDITSAIAGRQSQGWVSLHVDL